MFAQLLKPGLSTCMGAATAAATSQAAAMLQYYLVLLAAEYQLAAPEVGGGGAAGGVLVRAEHRAEPVHAHPDHAARGAGALQSVQYSSVLLPPKQLHVLGISAPALTLTCADAD